MAPYEELPHTADVRLRVMAPTLSALFEEAAAGMFALMNWRAGPPGDDVVEDLVLCAPDLEMLLVDWLSELQYRSESGGVRYTHFAVTLTGEVELRATIRGLVGGAPIKVIKAVTYHDLRIVAGAGGAFEAIITFDT